MRQEGRLSARGTGPCVAVYLFSATATCVQQLRALRLDGIASPETHWEAGYVPSISVLTLGSGVEYTVTWQVS